MYLQKRIGIVLKIQTDQDDGTAGASKSDTFKLDARTSLFAAFTNAVFSMDCSSYKSSYFHIKNDGVFSYSDYSHMTMISILRSNIGNKNKNKTHWDVVF